MKEALKSIFKSQVALIIIGVIWLFGTFFVVPPLAVALSTSKVNGVFHYVTFWENFGIQLGSMKSFTLIFNGVTFPIFLKTLFYYTIFIFVCIVIGAYNNRKKEPYEKIEHGSSDWSSGGEQYRILSKSDGILLAENNYLPLDKVGNINVLVIAGSGAGKTAGYAIPNAHQLLGSYVFTDPKGEIYDNTAGYLRQNGYEIKLLNLVNPASSDSYNPLTHIRSEIDVDIIANTIVRGQKSESVASDPYWDNMAELLLKSLIYYLVAKRPPEEQNLASCAELVRAANTSGDSNLLSDLINELPYDHPARMNYRSVEIASDRTYSSILSSLQSKLGKFDSKEIADVTSTNTIDFEEIASKKTALFVVSSDTHTAYDFLLTIFFSQMIQHLYDFADKNGGKLPNKTFFILDEFANIGQIPDFDKKISTSRSRGISFSVILQNLDQLKGIYEKSYETIIGNCDTHIFMGSNSFTTVEYFSKELGEKTISHTQVTKNKGKDKSKSESDQIMARALMTPDELRRMDTNDCIIFEKGVKPIKAKKYWWYKKEQVANDLYSTRQNHNEYYIENRGIWRKYNPYNPYTQNEIDEEHTQDLKVGSLDDLFTDANPNAEQQVNNQPNRVEQQVNNIVRPQQPKPQEKKNIIEEEETIDIQKELEAKFDELFGKE